MVKFRVAPIKGETKMQELAYLMSKFKKVVAPKRCQRPLCWSHRTKLKFFKSLLMNRVEGTFIFIDIHSAFEAIRREYHSNEKSYIFFEDLINANYRYIVIDGNNRYHFLEDLFSDQWLIPTGEYQYISNTTTGKIETFEVLPKKRKFSDLLVKVQDAIKERCSPVSPYSQLDLAGLADVFTNVNSGVALNRQELRNVMDVDYADLVRELEDDIMPLLNQLIDRPQLGLTGQEFIVDCIDFVLNGIIPTEGQPSKHNAINQGTKDELYNSAADSDYFYKIIYANLKLIQDYLPRMIDDEILGSGNSRKVKRKSAVQNLLWMMCNGLDASYESCVAAMQETENEYSSSYQYPTSYQTDDKSFRESCGGLNKECMQIRERILTRTINNVNESYINL